MDNEQVDADGMEMEEREEDGVMDSLRGENASLVARLREELLRANPGVPAELVTGETLEELEASFATARDLAGRILRSAAERVPAGAPGREPFARMTAREKIRAGLSELPPTSAGGS